MRKMVHVSYMSRAFRLRHKNRFDLTQQKRRMNQTSVDVFDFIRSVAFVVRPVHGPKIFAQAI